MNQSSKKSLVTAWTVLIIGAVMMLPGKARAHCDSLDGPVITAARAALIRGEVTPLLKWVRVDDEQEIRESFAQTQSVRKLGPEAQELADRYFFETLVRIHRAGEGAPYTGLKAAGNIEPVVAKADRALEKGSVDELARAIAAATEEGIRERFQHALEARKHEQDSVQAGRGYVEAYVTYVHYVEGIARVVHGPPQHGEGATQAVHQH